MRKGPHSSVNYSPAKDTDLESVCHSSSGLLFLSVPTDQYLWFAALQLMNTSEFRGSQSSRLGHCTILLFLFPFVSHIAIVYLYCD